MLTEFDEDNDIGNPMIGKLLCDNKCGFIVISIPTHPDNCSNLLDNKTAIQFYKLYLAQGEHMLLAKY